MPLMHGKSEKAFSKNVSTEMHHGKAQKQALAIAYHMQRKAKAKKMAEGGDSSMAEDPNLSPIARGMKKAFHTPGYDPDKKPNVYAEGGDVPFERKPYENPNPEKNKKDPIGQGVDSRGQQMYQSYEAKMAAKRRYQESQLHKKRNGYAEGGFIDEEEASGYLPMPKEHDDHDDQDDLEDMVGEIMKKRQRHYSHGGKVANESMPIVDDMDAEYDDLPKDDDLEENYTGANSGDECDDEQEDKDRHDIVSFIMKSRAKKDKMPRPA